MAWINVYEQVLGGKLRKLSNELECSQNEALGILIRLWLWSINNADRDGRIVGATKEDVVDAITSGMDRRYSPEMAVDALISTGWIDFGDALYIHDWEEWQSQWYKAADRRKRDTERKREQRKQQKEAEATEKSDGEKEKDLPKPRAAKKEYDKDFEDFFAVYPRRIGKGEAFSAYKARVRDGWKPEQLKAAAEEYARDCIKRKTEVEYIKHPKTFLSRKIPFSDYLPKAPAETPEENDDDNPYSEWRQE